MEPASQSTKPPIKLLLSAGEASGDIYGAEILEQLALLDPGLSQFQVFGMGGSQMQAHADIEIVQDSNHLGAMGPIDVLRKPWAFWQARNQLFQSVVERQPDLAVLIDYPGLHAMLAQHIRKHVPHCRIIKFIAPQVWLWREYRKYRISKLYDELLSIFPFERKIFADTTLPANYIGNPAAWRVTQKQIVPDKASNLAILQAANEHLGGLSVESPLIGIFPGSRQRGIETLLPRQLKAIQLLRKSHPDWQFVIVKAHNITTDIIEGLLQQHQLQEHVSVIDSEHNYHLMGAADMLWLLVGTVTLEAACLQKPALVGYLEHPIVWTYLQVMRHCPYLALPNVVADSHLYQELLQRDCTPERWAQATCDFLDLPQEEQQQFKNTIHEQVYLPLQADKNPFAEVANACLSFANDR